MQRENFRITSNIGHDVVKHKWNASVRETEKLAKELAIEYSTTYNLVDKESIKDGFNFASGYRTWQSELDGSIVTFTIIKEK